MVAQIKACGEHRQGGKSPVSLNLRINNSDNGRLVVVFALALVSAIGQCVSVGAVSLFASAAIVGVATFSPLRICLLELYVCLPFFNTMTSSVGSTSLYYLLLGVFIVKILVSGKGILTAYRFLALILVILLTIYNFENPYLYLRWLLVALPFVMLAGTDLMRGELRNVVALYSISTAISTFFGYYLSERGLMALTESYVYSDSGNISRFGGLVGDPVMFSETLVFLVACNLVLLLTGRGGRTSLACTVFLAVPCAMTYSKSAIILLAALLLFAAIHVMTHHLLDRRAFLTGVAALSVIFVIAAAVWAWVMSNPQNDIVSGFMLRLNADDLLTGRSDLWDAYVAWFKEQGVFTWLFGTGFSEYNQAVFPYFGLLLNRCHNAYLETVLLFGAVGTTLLVIGLTAFLIKSVRLRTRLPFYLPIVILLCFGIVLHGHVESFYYFLWIIALSFPTLDKALDTSAD